MPILDVWQILEDPAWITFGLMVGVGLLGLAALAFLYPFGRD